MKPCVCPPGVESLFPTILWISCSQSLLAFKARCSGGSSYWCQTPRLVSLTSGSELSLLRKNLCDRITFQSVGCQPTRHGMWLYPECSPPTIFSWHDSLFECTISYLVGSSLFCWWLFSSCEFWCAPERRWAQAFLLHHLVSYLKFLILLDNTLTLKIIPLNISLRNTDL